MLYMRAAIEDLVEATRRHAHSESITLCVPTLIRFHRRRDELVVDPRGNATLHWTFDIHNDDGEELAELHLPVYAALAPGVDPKDVVRVSTLQVDTDRIRAPEEYYSTADVRAPVEGGAQAWTRGVLRVPVQFGPAQRQRRIQAVLHFTGAFQPASTPGGCSFQVDIPYMTEHLEVHIRSERQVGICGLRDQAVAAEAALMGDRDHQETRRRSAEYRDNEDPTGRSLVWRAHMPKLGYRYNVSFRLFPPEPNNAALSV
jgi:hypothetical protein